MRPPRPLVRLFSQLQASRYRRSGGRRGGTFRGRPVLLLTTTGRRTGRARTTPLVYVRNGDSYVVVGSNAGHDHHPRWRANLLADPRATIQVAGERIPVTARFAEGDEERRLWERLVEHSPGFARYRRMTTRPFPVAVLSPRRDEDAGPAGE
jgi:deazaflavin-dependent oxidoreductase (nitroreductase family)